MPLADLEVSSDFGDYCSRVAVGAPRRRPHGPQARHQLGEAETAGSRSSASPFPTGSNPGSRDPEPELLRHHGQLPDGVRSSRGGLLSGIRDGPRHLDLRRHRLQRRRRRRVAGTHAGWRSAPPVLTSTRPAGIADNGGGPDRGRRPAEPRRQRLVRILAAPTAAASAENQQSLAGQRGRPGRAGEPASGLQPATDTASGSRRPTT